MDTCKLAESKNFYITTQNVCEVNFVVLSLCLYALTKLK